MSKRLFDILLSAIALIAFFPLLIIISLGILITMGRPVMFTQVRVGHRGVDFKLVKFRSMREAYDLMGRPLADEKRITPFGKFLRRSRLDELPELWLVLKGTMSLVGPRPLTGALLDEYGVRGARMRTRPGLTGLSQVSGNTLLNPTEKFAIDLFYNDHHSVWFDIKIILKTISVVLNGEAREINVINEAADYAKCVNRGG